MAIPQYLYGSNEELQRYFELVIRTLNALLGDDGWELPNLTSSQVTTVTSYQYSEILPPGTIWFNSALGKLQFIVTPADPSAPSNAIIETVTSV